MTQPSEILGCILAGGRSSRFGRDKARALLHGRPLLLHAAEWLRPVCRLVLAAADSPGKYQDLQIETLVDDQPGQGPLAGLEAALQQAKSRLGEQAWVLLVPCDTPGLRPEWARQLLDARQADDLALAFRDQTAPPAAKAHGWEPMPALVSVRALPAVQLALAQAQTALWRLLETVDARAVAQPADWLQHVHRLDTPDELHELQELTQPARDVPVRVQRWSLQDVAAADDWLASEEPLEIRVEHGPLGQRRSVVVGVVLRTPGHEVELAVGLLYSESAIEQATDVLDVIVNIGEHAAATVRLRPGLAFDTARLSRHVVTSAACGACGVRQLDLALPVGRGQLHGVGTPVPWHILAELPEKLRALQTTFARTGGLHAAGLFDLHGQPLRVREDIGRHNALDKLVGFGVLYGQPPGILVLSGRIGFELVQKAALAGLPLLVGVGAPTSLAVDLADRAGMTVVGFVRSGRGNVYTAPWRVVSDTACDT